MLIENCFSSQSFHSTQYRGRFAPSTTGPLHLGNLRTALLSWLKARSINGEWLLRMDDLDTPRNRLGAIESIVNDLEWLGLFWDGPILFQSKRKEIYNFILQALKEQGRLYACRCSRKTLLNTNQLDIYRGSCRILGFPFGEYEDDRLPSWRLKVSREFSEKCGDIVLRRADGYIAYHLATVVDELFLGITEVIRGEDLKSVINAQLALFDSLGRDPLVYKYVPVMHDSKGKKLSKRYGSNGIEPYKNSDSSPNEVIGLLAGSLDLIPKNTSLSASELLQEVKNNKSLLANVIK